MHLSSPIDKIVDLENLPKSCQKLAEMMEENQEMIRIFERIYQATAIV